MQKTFRGYCVWRVEDDLCFLSATYFIAKRIRVSFWDSSQWFWHSTCFPKSCSPWFLVANLGCSEIISFKSQEHTFFKLVAARVLSLDQGLIKCELGRPPTALVLAVPKGQLGFFLLLRHKPWPRLTWGNPKIITLLMPLPYLRHERTRTRFCYFLLGLSLGQDLVLVW